MDFLGIGPGELLLIIIVIFIVMGPGKIVQVSRDLGKMVSAFRKASSDLTNQVTRELEDEEKKQSTAQQVNQPPAKQQEPSIQP